MAETPKTLIFLGVAVAMTALAFVFRPTPIEAPQQEKGDKLFSEMEDATAAASLEIVHFDSDTDEPQRLKIARDGAQWVIASHNNYPADAEDAQERIRDTALSMMDMEIIDLASELTSDHAQFGVLAPDSEKVDQANADDVGILVGLLDDKGKNLARLVVGKEVEGFAGQRFVRKAGQNPVYVARFDVEKLSSKFEDWIEEDLLDVNNFDISELVLKDYNFDIRQVKLPTGQTALAVDHDPRLDVTVAWNNDDSKWQLKELLEHRRGQLVPSQLHEGEELNKEKLDQLKSALDDLKLVDVESKPKELVGALKTDQDLLNDPKIGPSLMEKGFYPISMGGQPQLLSSNGEVRVRTKDGIEYILRFGGTAGVQEGEDEAKLNRYLLVSARVNEAAFVKDPPASEEPGDDQPTTGAAGAEGESGEQANETEPAGAADSAAADAEKADDENTNDAGAADAPASDKPADEPPADDKPADDAPADDAPADDAPADESDAPADDAPADPGDAAPIDPAGDEPTEEDEMAKKRKEAEKKVADLNKRFANWYYIISEDVYKKIHLGRFDIIQQKDSAFDPGELKPLDEGLERGNPANELP